MAASPAVGDRVVVDPGALDILVRELSGAGYRVVGPTVRDGAVVLGELRSAADLPVGWTEDQEAGHYRLRARGDGAKPRLAFLGVRACDLRAIAVGDRIFAEGEHADPTYVSRRGSAFLVAVNCTDPGGTCFCTSMGTGPRVPGWLTHKLGTWWDQFGTSGCVGCGRCITWCPVVIDIVEEIRALREPVPAAQGSRRRA